jgi:hypothetical protein
MLSCKENTREKLIEGDIYITLINIYNPKDILEKEKFEELKKIVTNYNDEKKYDSENKIYKYYKVLMKHGLFHKPCFQLKIKNGEIINVYINEDEYSKLKYELKNLERDKEKIKVTFLGSKISKGIHNKAIYSASKVVFFEKTFGKTEWKK